MMMTHLPLPLNVRYCQCICFNALHTINIGLIEHKRTS